MPLKADGKRPIVWIEFAHMGSWYVLFTSNVK
jgi:hypothetical protein